jgi:hypothetical protein
VSGIVWSRRLSAVGRASPTGHEFVPGRRRGMLGRTEGQALFIVSWWAMHVR